MWNKLKDQLPAVIVTLVLIGGLAFWQHSRTVNQMTDSQQREIANLRAETNHELRAAAEDTRAQIEAVNQLLKDAIEQRSSDLFLTDEEAAAVNDERINELAQAIARKMNPYGDVPQSPEEAMRQETAQIDRVSDRLAQRIEPLLASLSSDTALTRATLQEISAEISDQLSIVLTNELAKNQRLSSQLMNSQAIARDSMILAQELGTLYLSSKDNDGVLNRLLTLPANIVRDTSKGSLLSSAESKNLGTEIADRMSELQDRLDMLNEQIPAAAEDMPVATE